MNDKPTKNADVLLSNLAAAVRTAGNATADQLRRTGALMAAINEAAKAGQRIAADIAPFCTVDASLARLHLLQAAHREMGDRLAAAEALLVEAASNSSQA